MTYLSTPPAELLSINWSSVSLSDSWSWSLLARMDEYRDDCFLVSSWLPGLNLLRFSDFFNPSLPSKAVVHKVNSIVNEVSQSVVKALSRDDASLPLFE